MHRITSLVWSAVLLLTATSCIPAVEAPADRGKITTLILVRHCERDPGLDPPLNAEGQARALALRAALSENGVDAIYCTNLLRNRQSVEPLALALGLAPVLIDPALYANTITAGQSVLSQILDDHRGQTILFCGNRGSVLETPGITDRLYRELGGAGAAPDRYQDFYVCIVPEVGATQFIKTVYGGVSSLD